MATYHVFFHQELNGSTWVNLATITEVATPPVTYGNYYNWDDFYSVINTLRTSHTIIHNCGSGDDDNEFVIFKEEDFTFTLKRKHYVDNVFAGYVNVESGFTTILGVIDRINLIYVNGNQYHVDRIAAMDINTLGDCWD